MKRTKLLAVLACILGAQNIVCMNLTNSEVGQKKEVESCPLLIKNTSGSPIWISQDPTLADALTIDELEQLHVQAIQPYEVEPIHAGTTFTIHTRMPQSNTNYQKNFTVVQRLCDPDNDEYAIDFSLLAAGQADPSRFIVINHLKEKDAPEGAYPLCPGGLLPELDEETDQWFCKVYRYSDVYEKFVDEYVPVLSYIYQWLPSSIWTPWYIKNPQFYNWYHRHPEFYSHLAQYQAPWQTKEYATWYKAQSATIRSSAREPEPIDSLHSAPTTKSPMGMPESKIKTKASVAKPKETFEESNKKVAPPITVYSKERKKQDIEDIISSHAHPPKPEIEIKEEEKKEIVQATRTLKYYDRKTKPLLKPMAMSKRCILKTQSGSHPITL